MAVEIGLESDSVAQAIINHMKECVDWEGTCCELLDSLTKSEEERITRTKNWPKTPSTLSNRIRRLAPALRMVGINVEFTRKVQGRRHIQLRKDEEKSVTAVTQTSNSMENIVVDGSDAGDGELPISSDWWPGLWEDI